MVVNPFLLAFPAAIEFFRKKRVFPTEKWNDLNEAYSAIAFTIAGITKASILKDLQDAITSALENGISPEQFRAQFTDIMVRRGWSSGFSPYRQNLIFSQAVRTSYNYGRFEQLTDSTTIKSHPHWQWRWRDSPRPRPHHESQDGKVFPANDPCFKAILPQPWGCRCTVYALNDRQLKKEGLTLSTPPKLSAIAEPGFTQGFTKSLDDQRQQLIKDALKRLPPNLAKLLEEDADFNEPLDFYDSRQPRDKDGKFAKRGGGQGLPSMDALVNEEIEARTAMYSGSRAKKILIKGKSYEQIESSDGKEAAETALRGYIKELSTTAATSRFNQAKLDLDEQQKAKVKQKLRKQQEKAFKELHPKSSLTLDEFEKADPKAASTLLDRYQEKKKKDASSRASQSIGEQKRLAQVEQAKKSFDNAPDSIIKAVEKHGHPPILRPERGESAYFLEGQGVHMDSHKEYYESVYRHEWGHYVDYKLGNNSYLSSSDAGKKAFDLDVKAFDKDLYGGLINSLLKDEAKNNKSDTGYGWVADIAGAITKNKVGHGHSDSYFDWDENRRTETFANIVSLVGSGNPKLESIALRLAPNMYKLAMEKMGE